MFRDKKVLDLLKKEIPGSVSIQDHVEKLKEDSPTIIYHNYVEPTVPPWHNEDIEVFDFAKHPQTGDDVDVAYGIKPSVPAMNVINAMRSSLGNGGYTIHMSDSSYSGYTIHELKEYIDNFDSTDLKVYIPEAFDCDDFSQVLQGSVNGFFPGIAFGTIWYGPNKPRPDWGHSVNLFYHFRDNKIYLIEPQNDVFYTFNKKLWKAWMVII